MANQTNFTLAEDVAPRDTAAGIPADGRQEPSPERGPVMRIKNLDTGEEFELEEYDVRPPAVSGRHSASGDGEQPGALDEDEEQPDRVPGAKKKAWLKSTKKFKTWAKTTLTNVKGKIEERIEKQQLHRQLQQQQKQKHQEQQQKQKQDGFGVWDGDDEPRDDAFTVPDLAGSFGPEPGQAAADAGLVAFGDSILKGGLEGVIDDETSFGRGGSFDERVTSSSAATTAVLPANEKLKQAAAGSASSRGATGLGTRCSVEADGGMGAISSADSGYPSSAAAVVTESTRGSASLKGAATANKPYIPPLPSLRGLIAPQPGVPPAAAAAAAAAATAASVPAAAAAPASTTVSLSGVAAQHQSSEDLRIPLLEEDLAGPSSRAVPTAKSWLNQAARVIGGRRAAGRQLQQVRMVQELLGHDGPVWAMKFSADARLLATAGRDGVLRVWSVYWYAAGRSKLISPARDDGGPATAPLGRAPGGAAAAAAAAAVASGATGSGTNRPRPPLLSESPLLCLPGHRSDVLDLSWSQCRLLLTASADQTARLWCIDAPAGLSRVPAGGGGFGIRKASGSGSGSGSGAEGSGEVRVGYGGGEGGVCPSGECLRSFVHPDFVTSCCFHPSNPRCIVTGCADGKIRIWSVPEAAVVTHVTVPQDIITRVLFSAHGSRVLAGTLRGKVRYYEFSGGALEYLTQLDVKNPHGSGRKVTGLAQVPYTYGNDQLYFITSADSRIRLYVGYTQERKFKGHRHTNTQIAASLSPSSQYLICGSDDGWVYVWETGLPPSPSPAAAAVEAAGPAIGSSLVRGSPGPAGSGAAGAMVGPGAAPPPPPPGCAGGRGGIGVKETMLSAAAGRGIGKVKEGSFESFQTPESTTTVAIVAPNVCRLDRGLDRSGWMEASGDRYQMGPTFTLLGALFLVAGYSGKIYVYENLPLQWV